jgi:hypothetical protein
VSELQKGHKSGPWIVPKKMAQLSQVAPNPPKRRRVEETNYNRSMQKHIAALQYPISPSGGRIFMLHSTSH